MKHPLLEKSARKTPPGLQSWGNLETLDTNPRDLGVSHVIDPGIQKISPIKRSESTANQKSPHLSARPAGNAPTARSNALVGYLRHDDQQISQRWWFSGKRWCKLAGDWIFMLFLRQFNIRWQQKKWQMCIVTSIFWTVSLLNWGKYLDKAN